MYDKSVSCGPTIPINYSIVVIIIRFLLGHPLRIDELT